MAQIISCEDGNEDLASVREEKFIVSLSYSGLLMT